MTLMARLINLAVYMVQFLHSLTFSKAKSSELWCNYKRPSSGCPHPLAFLIKNMSVFGERSNVYAVHSCWRWRCCTTAETTDTQKPYIWHKYHYTAFKLPLYQIISSSCSKFHNLTRDKCCPLVFIQIYPHKPRLRLIQQNNSSGDLETGKWYSLGLFFLLHKVQKTCIWIW